MKKTHKVYIYLGFFICIMLAMYGAVLKTKIREESVLTNATPVSNKTIILDAGHGLPDERSIFFFTVQLNKK